jgi:hypothetical protein
MALIIPILVLFFNTSPRLTAQETFPDTSGYSLFFIKEAWHTGIVLQTSRVDPEIWPQIKDFLDYEWIDVGWGEEIFYLDPDPGVREAVLALFYRTPSTLRVEGFNYSIKRYVGLSDKAGHISVTKEKFDQLSAFIARYYELDEDGNAKILHRYRNDQIIYYASIGKYHLFNTCNTWVAKALKHIGFNVKTDVVLADQLFQEINKHGIIVKEADN